MKLSPAEWTYVKWERDRKGGKQRRRKRESESERERERQREKYYLVAFILKPFSCTGTIYLN